MAEPLRTARTMAPTLSSSEHPYGWQAFTTLGNYHLALRRRARQPLQPCALLRAQARPCQSAGTSVIIATLPLASCRLLSDNQAASSCPRYP
jgi:hypothetical protein